MEKQEALLAGTLLRTERLRQGMEQKAVCYGLCVPSYLCKIEQEPYAPIRRCCRPYSGGWESNIPRTRGF